MELAGRTVVVTGGASGIGAAMAARFDREAPRAVVVADLDAAGARAVTGIGRFSGLEASDDEWRRVMDVNLMAHVHAARALVPRWVARGAGYLVATASPAGLLAQIGDVTYTVSKHAAVAFAEWLSITCGDAGVRVSRLCPMGA